MTWKTKMNQNEVEQIINFHQSNDFFTGNSLSMTEIMPMLMKINRWSTEKSNYIIGVELCYKIMMWPESYETHHELLTCKFKIS